ncbi:MAG: FG-GAP-like repeat-containing protein [Planctomycetaceae bacterium]|nr:FG-GAP-like repeat-containing protein [Planctomycetaceae bacterium]
MVRSVTMRKLPLLKAAFFVSVCCLIGCSQSKPPEEILRTASLALSRGDYAQVERLADSMPADAEQWQAVMLLSAEAATKQGQAREALSRYEQVNEKDPASKEGQEAAFYRAETLLGLAELTEAEAAYEQVLTTSPTDGITNARLAFLKALTGREWEALPHYFVLIKRGDADFGELALAADVGRALEQPEFLENCRKLNPDDPGVRQAVVSLAWHDGDQDAQDQLEELVRQSPEMISAQARLGEFLVDAVDPGEFLRWHAQLPPAADSDPGIWLVRGLWARKQGKLPVAVDCFYESIIRTPFHRRAYHVLAQALIVLEDERAEDVLAYSERMIALTQSVDQVLINEGGSEPAFRRTAELLEELGRIWEACAWAVVARDAFPGASWPTELFDRNTARLTEDLPWIEREKNLVAGRTPGSVPEFFQLLDAQSAAPSTGRLADTLDSRIQFVDTRLIPFEYYNAHDEATKGLRTQEQTGGAVGVLDVDSDGRPDVLLTQGTEWQSGSAVPAADSRLSDRLFRNREDRFEDITDVLGGDSGFGQGCSVVDFNNDGFDDIYVANVGANALYQNMGDGTFVNITDSLSLAPAAWTVSTLCMDLNGDGHPDLFDVNYLSGDDLYVMICGGRACSPSVFPGAQDQLLISNGQGGFERIDGATPDRDSKGLGIVAFQQNPGDRPMIFIANDQVANYFLVNSPADNQWNIELANQAMINGLALNDVGLAMACMGVAVDDWDNNGLYDLFVTNFHAEPNTLYLQDAPGLFLDNTRAAGLQAASIPYTGWGTQALDADLDGWSDLVLTNGHVDDYRDEGGEYHMRPQFFQNVQGRFRELTASAAGPWFGEKFLGRGLARLDWNMDGRPEFIVSNMNARVSVMKNESTGVGRFLKVRLAAVATARDAIGARVTVQAGGNTWVRQLTAGDGYLASNERELLFGLGTAATIERIDVEWPSGATSVIKDLSPDCRLQLVEGLPTATCVREEVLSAVDVSLPDVSAEPSP